MVVFQCPPSFGETSPHIENLRRFFGSLKEREFLFAWEPRGEWQEETIRALCAELGLIHGVDPLVRRPLYGELQYFRLHGGPHYRHRYSEEELKRLRSLLGDKESYVLFNNLNMYQDAQSFVRLMKEAE